MKKRTRNLIITACVAVVVVAAVLVGVFVGKPMVERQQVEQEFTAIQQRRAEESANSRKLMYYDENLPLSEMDTHNLEIYLPQARAAAKTALDRPEEEAYHLPLPVDVEYYATPDDSTAPAYTIPKGTEVLLYDSHEIDPIDPAPYGCVCYPDYQKGWRYGRVFLTMDSGSTIADSEEELPYYYVRTEDLEAVLGAYYDKYQEIFSQEENRQEYLAGYIQFIDRSLFVDGSFCSPELEHLWESYLMAKQMAENTEG